MNFLILFSPQKPKSNYLYVLLSDEIIPQTWFLPHLHRLIMVAAPLCSRGALLTVPLCARAAASWFEDVVKYLQWHLETSPWTGERRQHKLCKRREKSNARRSTNVHFSDRAAELACSFVAKPPRSSRSHWSAGGSCFGIRLLNPRGLQAAARPRTFWFFFVDSRARVSVNISK